MKRALSIFTAGLMAAPVAIAQESAEGLEVAELSRKEDVDFATAVSYTHLTLPTILLV